MSIALKLLSPSQAAAELGVGRTKLLQLVRDGRIAVKMLDGRIRIPVEALQEFRDALPAYEKGQPVVKSTKMVSVLAKSLARAHTYRNNDANV